MNKKQQYTIDERDEKNIGVASQWAILFAMIYTLGKIIYYLGFSGVEDLGFLIWDGLLLLLIGLIITVVSQKRQTFVLPRTFLGHKLLTEQNRKARKERMFKAYLPETIIFAVGFTLGSHLNSGYETFIHWLAGFCVYFVIFMLINSLWGEFTVRQYNKALKD